MKIRKIALISVLGMLASFAQAKDKRNLDVEEVSAFEESPSFSAMSSMIPTNLPWPVDNKDIRHTSIFFDTDDAVEISGRPCNGNRFEKHVGVDIQTSVGTNVKAVYPGVVEHIGNGGNNGGKGIVISHDNNSWTSTTWHLTSDIQVSKGDNVVAGQVLGYIYDTSYPANDVPHVHFGIRPSPYDSYSIRGFGLCEEVNNNLLGFVNPYNYLSNNGYGLIDDSEATHSGSWVSSNNADLYTDKGYKALTNGKTGTATYEYTIPSNGNYSIYTRFTPYSDRTANATYKVYVNNTLKKTVSIDQSNMIFRGDNVFLVGYNYVSSGMKFKIVVSNGSGSGALISDAILFRKR